MNKAIVHGLLVILCILCSAGAAFSARAAGPDGRSTDVPQLMAKQGCTACHAMDSQRVGPAFGWVAYRYRGMPRDKAVSEAANFIISGGIGYWEPWVGALPMPSHSNMSRTEAEELARWILSRPPVKPPAKPGN